MFNLSVRSLLSNAKLLVTILVLAGGVTTLLLKESDTTAAFLSTNLKNIGMGVSTDEWEPPQQPQILGYLLEDSENLVACENLTSQESVLLSWSQPESETTTVSQYFVGTATNPRQFELAGESNTQEIFLEEGLNSYQVLAVDERGEESPVSQVCVIKKDTLKPEVAITSPEVELLGSDISVTAQIIEANLAEATIQIKNDQGEIITEGGELLADDQNPQQQTLSFEWNASQEPSGIYAITVLATDEIGLSSTEEKQIALDTQKPVATLAMVVPSSDDSGLLKNGGFEDGLNGWITQGSFEVSGLNDVSAEPQEGSLSAVLGNKDESSAVAIVSQDLSSVAEQVNSVGFWYYLDPTQGISNTEGMMVFIDDTLVFEDWLNQEDATWKYIQVDARAASDPTITVAYYHDDDKTTGGRLYLDGFVANQEFAIEDIAFDLSTSDNSNEVTGFAKYLIAGQETILRTDSQTSFTLSSLPDDSQITYWAEDSVGNKSDEKILKIPTMSSVSSEEKLVEEDSSEDSVLKAELLDTGDYSFKLVLSNVPSSIEATYEVVYTHGESQKEGLQGAFEVAEDETSLSIEDLYFGTCSATAGEQCSPHLNIQDIEVVIKVIDQVGEVTEYSFEYPGGWVTTVSAEVAVEEQDAAI